MSELRIPLDVEQLTELSQLKSLLRTARTTLAVPHPPAKEIEVHAGFLLLRLFVVLGYLARSTNKPGRLTAAGAFQLRESLEPLYGDNCDPVKLLADAQLLVSDGNEWHCPLFAKLNEHLAGDYRPKHIKGNDMRQVGIAIREAATAAPHQAQLLIPEACVKPDGKAFEPQELDRLMIIIGAIDRQFKFTRLRTMFTSPLLNAAAAAAVKCGYTAQVVPEEFRQFLGWLQTHKTSPRVPPTTEQVLADFATLFELSKAT